MVDPVRIKVFLDSGLQKTFIPLRKPTNYTDLPKNVQIPESLQKALDEIENYDAIIPENTKNILDQMFNGAAKRDWKCFVPYLRARFGQKIWHLKNGLEVRLNGIWFMIETNTSAQDANQHQTKYDRGYFYQSNGLSEDEKNKIIDAKKNNLSYSGGESHYIPLKPNETLPLEISFGDDTIDFGELRFELAIKTPGGEVNCMMTRLYPGHEMPQF